MATHNNWMTHNLRSRFLDSSADFKVILEPYDFIPMPFNEAADYTVKLIEGKYQNIFLSFSGGFDSDFVFHVMQRNKVPFTPLVVKTSGNQVEMEYALYTCRKFNITPIIINLEDKDYLSFYDNQILKKINGHGLCAVPGIFACNYAKDHNGICVIGEHMIDNNENSLFPGLNEWDFYNEVFVGEAHNIPFFNYTLELTNAMISQINNNQIDEWKHELYQLDYRPIIDYQFSDLFNMIKAALNAKRKSTPNSHYCPGTKSELLEIFSNKYIK